MKKNALLFAVLISICITSYAQVALYTFSQSTNTYTEITGGTVLGNTSTDEQYFVDPTVPLGDATTDGVGFPIGFNFTYNGNVFDRFAVNANGWISLGQSSLTPSVNMQSSNAQTPISATSTASGVLQNRIAAFGRNLAAQSSSVLRYETIGTAPDRELVVQWKSYRKSSTATGDNINFQIRLHETTNTINFIYGTFTYIGTNAGVQVGLRGETNTDFKNRQSASGWSSTTAGTANTSTVTISSLNTPASGLTFIFNMPVFFSDDAGISAINLPLSPTPVGINNVAVTIKNFGTDSLKNADVEWSVNGVLQTPFTFNHTGLPKDSVAGPLVIGSFDFDITGNFVVKAWTSLPNASTDGNNANDTVVKNVYAQFYASLPFAENFDSLWVNKNDTNDVPSLFWNNTPAVGNSSWRRNDDTLSASWTSVSGAYTPTGASNTAHSARFHSYMLVGTAYSGTFDVYLDFSATGGKVLDFWYINTSGNDSMAVYLSTDNGATFGFLQKLTTAASWTHNSINLGNSTSSNCVLRFRGTSANLNTTDFGIDEVQVYIQPNEEMGALDWVSPAGGCGLTDSEAVTVRVVNMGLMPQSNIPVRYSIDGGATFVGPELIPGPVNPNDIVIYTFDTLADFSAAGIYQCIFVVDLPGDVNNYNDTAFKTITTLNGINTFPFTEDFSMGGSQYFMLSAGTEAAVTYDTLGVLNSYGLHFTGKTTTGWSSGNTTEAQAWSYTAHISNAVTCNIDASGTSQLYLKLDLRETSSNASNLTYTWFGLVINNTDTITDLTGKKFFNPLTAEDDIYETKVFDISSHANTSFTMKLIASCRRNLANSTTGSADDVLIDNIVIYTPPMINDLGADTAVCVSYLLDAGAGIGYSYLWLQQPSGDTLGNSQWLLVDTTGTYLVIVTDTLGFTAADMITITVNQPPVVSAGNDTIIVSGSSAFLYASVLPAGGPYAYYWTPDILLNNNMTDTPTTAALTASTVFTVTVTDTITGCTASDNVTVIVFGGPLVLTLSASADSICMGDPVTLTAVPGGGTGMYTYSWNTGETTAEIIVYPDTITTYYFTLDDGVDNIMDSITIYVSDCTGLIPENMENTFYLYPNPSGGRINVIGNINTEQLLYVYNVLGELLYSDIIPASPSDTYALDLSFLQKGIYLVKISDGKNMAVLKCVLQ